MKYFIILALILASLVFSQYATAYHGEREEQEMLQMTGLFTPQMEMVRYPVVDQEYHLQVVVREESQYANSTISVGYGFNHVDRIPNKLDSESIDPFLGFESTHSSSGKRDSKTIETINYDFPIIVNFTVAFDKQGVHTYSFFEHSIEPGGSGGSNGGGYLVVAKYSKAIDENGSCKNSELLELPKHDFSKLVCVKQDTHHELITRGWAPLPG